MALNKFGVMNELLNILNTNKESSSETILAKYLLEHFNQIPELNIYDVADDCFINRATVRRFCHSIGLNNFKDFKDEQLPHEYYKSLPDITNYPDYLSNNIYRMSKDVNECLPSYMYLFADQLYRAKQCVFLVSDIYSSCCGEFQKSMIYCNKMVRVISSGYQNNELLNGLDRNDLIVVVSISGRWAREINDLVSEYSCDNILLTTIHKEFEDKFNNVYYVSQVNQPQIKTVYHQFAVPYVLEVILKLYGDTYCVGI